MAAGGGKIREQGLIHTLEKVGVPAEVTWKKGGAKTLTAIFCQLNMKITIFLIKGGMPMP